MTEIKTAYISTLAIAGFRPSQIPIVIGMVNESAVLRMNFCAKKPRHRKSAKRWVVFFYICGSLTGKYLESSPSAKAGAGRENLSRHSQD